MSTVATVPVLVVAILGGSAHAKERSPQQKKDAVAAARSADAGPSRPDVQEDPVLRRLFLERFYLPRRAMNLDRVQQAIAAGELPRDTDADLLIDALTGPLYFRRIIGHAPVSEAFASELASRVLQAFRRPVGL